MRWRSKRKVAVGTVSERRERERTQETGSVDHAGVADDGKALWAKQEGKVDGKGERGLETRRERGGR